MLSSVAALLLTAPDLGPSGAEAAARKSVQVQLGPRQGSIAQQLAAGCRAEEPFFGVSVFYPTAPDAPSGGELAGVAISTTGERLSLSNQASIGSTYGLAYDAARGHLFAAAYHKLATQFGPSGPGAIYDISLNTAAAMGIVTPFAVLDVGPDRHLFSGRDPFWDNSSDWVGRSSLGDIDLDDTASTLFVTNLTDRRIYRVAMADGTVLGSFANGGATEPWAANARPMGLGFHAGWLYHGVIDSREDPSLPGTFAGYVYRSRPDGTGMIEVAKFGLNYTRYPPWRPWTAAGKAAYRTEQPLISDLVFRADGDLVIGLRDAGGDTGHSTRHGDLLPAHWDGTRFDVATASEWYRDETIEREVSWGGLALFPGHDWVVSTAVNPDFTTGSGGLIWFNNRTGNRMGAVTVYRVGPGGYGFSKAQGLGDVEGLCAGPVVPTVPPTEAPPATATFTREPSASTTATASLAPPTETPRPSDTATLTGTPPATATTAPSTSRTATGTAPPSSTPTAFTPTSTRTPRPTARPQRLFLPISLKEQCPPQDAFVDVVLVIDASNSMREAMSTGESKLSGAIFAVHQFLAGLRLERGRDRAAIVGFNKDATLYQGLTDSRSQLDNALARFTTAQYSRIDLGIRGGSDELLTRGRGRALPVLILLSDGLSNPVPASEALAAAARAQRFGFSVYVVGLGPNMDQGVLRAMASRPEYYYPVPDPTLLSRIYSELARRVPCSPSLYWGDR